MAFIIYVLLGYLAIAFVKEDFSFNDPLRMFFFSILLGWIYIPVAIIKLIIRFFEWLFKL